MRCATKWRIDAKYTASGTSLRTHCAVKKNQTPRRAGEDTSCQDGPAEKGLNMKLGWLLIFPGIPLLFALVASLVMAIVNYVLCPEELAAVFGGQITFNKAACLTLLLCLHFFRVHRA